MATIIDPRKRIKTLELYLSTLPQNAPARARVIHEIATLTEELVAALEPLEPETRKFIKATLTEA